MTAADRVKVTHTLSAQTRDDVRALVAAGQVRDASAFIEEAVRAALQQRKWSQLDLELQAFDDPEYVEQVAVFGDGALEDIAQELRHV